MAVSVLRRKRIIAVIFAVCLITALFLYKKSVRETWHGNEVGGSKNIDFSRLDLSNEPETKITTIPFPTKIYSVIELEDEETSDDQDEETTQDGIKMEERENYEKEEMFEAAGGASMDDNMMETRVGVGKERINIKIGERIASSEQSAEGGRDNKDTTGRDEMEKGMRNIEDEKQAGDKLEQRIENEDWEFKNGKKNMDENKIERKEEIKDSRQENKMEGTVEESKDEMKGKSTEDQEATKERKNEPHRDESRRMEESRMRDKTRMRDESSVRDESRMRGERDDSVDVHDDRRQPNVYTVMTGYVWSTAKPIRPLSPTQSVQRGLVLKTSTVKSKPTMQASTETHRDKSRRMEEFRTRDKTRMRDESSVRDESRMRGERVDSLDVHDDRRQSSVHTVMTGYVRLSTKPIRPLSPTQSVQRGLVLKSSTGTRSSAKTTIPNARTTKATWVTKTTEMNNPRLEKIRQPRRKAETNPPTVKQSPPRTQTNSTKEPLTCKIPALDPFHPHVLRLQKNVGTNLRKICRSMYPYTPAFKVNNNKLVLKKNVKEASIVKSSIKLQEIRRLSDENFRYKKPRNPFNGLSNLYKSNDIGQSDFFRLEYKIDERWASDLYARVSPKLDVLERQTKLARQFREKGLPLNVLIIGLDSISRANFIRKLPRVKSFLETKLNTYFMGGMSIVGDATTPILTAMLTGKDETMLPEGRTSFGGKPIDNWPWIMKDYERQGYMTLYAEDDPSVSSFNLRLTGFTNSPTHHYMRPFWLSLESENERDEPGRCSKSESMVNHTLKYVKSFFYVYPTSRKFAFAFLSYLAHAHPNHLSFAEEDLMWFLRTFVDRGYLNDTMLVIMGDHGSRNSEYRDTMQGKLEERLPWFSVSLPSDFHRKFADLAANLRSNQDIITSSFDVHATLRHILTYPSVPTGEQTQSLFERLPRNRTCKNAGIAEHWCPCFQWSPTDINSKHVQSIAVSAVALINEKLSKVPLLHGSCHKLSLEGVLHAVTLRPNNKVQKFYSTDQDGDRSVNFAERTQDLLRYQIIFKTQPNQAKYEVTGHVSRNQVALNPEISRLNCYNDQPACIAKQYPYARKFCYCRTSA